MKLDDLRKYLDIINESTSPQTDHVEESSVEEKWGEPTVVPKAERGKYKGWSLAELRKAYNALKARGPHTKGSPELGRLRELAFAIRAKTGWGKVK